MNDTELAALTALVNGQRMEMEATNTDREKNGHAMAYDDSVTWESRDALEEELLRRKLLGDVPSDHVLLPRALTAENGAKALLIGEFAESVHTECPYCKGAGDNGPVDCEECEGRGDHPQDIPVGWTNIKKIYATVVKHFERES